MPNLRSKTWTTTTPANVEDAQYWEDHLISDEAAQKAASSVQTVNSTAPDANGNVDVVALPAGGTTGQVLTKISNTSGDADWLDPSSSGHTIEDDDGTTMTQRSTLQFTNAEVTDDSVNGKTVVDCKGSKGDPGDAATVTVGTVTTLPAGSSATVTNSGTTSAAVFNFGIPKGADGSGAGDMLKSDYDSTSAVITAGGIVDYVAGVLPVITNTYSSTSEDGMSGKAVASAIGGITIPVITNTYSSTSEDGMSGKAVKQAIDGLTIPDDLNDLTDVAYSGTPAQGQALIVNSQGKWQNQALPSGGHDMIPVAGDMAAIAALEDGDDNYVVNAYSTQRWSNCDVISLMFLATKGTDTIGDWEAEGTWDASGGSRSGWLWSADLYQVLEDGDGNEVIDIEIEPVHGISQREVVSLYAYRIDDDIDQTIGGVTVHGGAIAFKLNNKIQSNDGVMLGIKLIHHRTKKGTFTQLS